MEKPTDAEVLRAGVLASAITDILEGESESIVGAAMSLVLAKWLAQFPDAKQEKALDLILAGTARFMAAANAK